MALNPQDGIDIVTERMRHTGVKIRHHHESWWGTLVGRLAYACMGKSFPTQGDATVHDWVIVQTIGSIVWIPANWEDADAEVRFEILLHEEEHTQQFRRWGMGSPSFGVLTMGFAYLFLLPIFWTMRARFEKAAYAQSIRARHLLGDPPGEGFRRHLIENFTTRNYVWMMGPWAKRKLTRWFWRTSAIMYDEARNGRP